MDFLNKTFRQLTDLFQSMTPAARLTSGILFAVVVVSLLYLFQFPLSHGDSYIFADNQLSTEERNLIAVALSDAGYSDFEFTPHGIKVPAAKTALYYKAIKEGDAVPFGRWNDEPELSPFLSRTQQEQAFLASKKKRLERMVSDMHGFETVDILYSEGDPKRFGQEKIQTASVTVKKSLGKQLTEDEADSIRGLVAGAFAGTEPSNIRIVDQRTSKSFTASASGSLASPENSVVTKTMNYYERHYEEKIRDRLQEYGATVFVTADLNPETSNVKFVREIDDTPTTVSTNVRSREETMEKKSIQGPPGLNANSPTATAGGTGSVAAIGQPVSSTIVDTEEDNKMTAGESITKSAIAGLMLKSTRCSIGIPDSYYRRIFLEQAPPGENDTPAQIADAYAQFKQVKEPEVEKEIQDIVRPLLTGLDGIDNPFEFIVVSSDPTPEVIEIETPSMVDDSMVWLAQNWQMIGMMMMGLVSLVILRSTVKSAMASSPNASDNAPQLDSAIDAESGEAKTPATEDEDPEYENELLKRFTLTGPDLRDDLTEIVQQDPDAAAAVLKSWIGDGV